MGAGKDGVEGEGITEHVKDVLAKVDGLRMVRSIGVAGGRET